MPPSVLREELLALVADRMSLSPELLSSLLGRGGRLAVPDAREGGRVPTRLPAQELSEREFLAYCIAFPDLGRPALAELDLARDFVAESTRRAAGWLRDHDAREAVDDGELTNALTPLRVRAQSPEITRGKFEVQRLQLALGRVRRDIDAAPAGSKTALAQRREELLRAYDEAVDRALGLDRLPAE